MQAGRRRGGRAGRASRSATRPTTAFLGAPFVAMPFVDGPIPVEFTRGRSLARRTARRRRPPARCGARSSTRSAAIHARRRRRARPAGRAHRRARVVGALPRLGHRRVAARRAWPTPWRGAGPTVPRDEPPSVAAVGRRPARQRRVRPRPPRAAGGPRLGHGERRAGRDGPRLVPRPRAAPGRPHRHDRARLRRPATRPSRSSSTGLGRALQDLGWYEVFALVRASAVSTRIAVLFERAGQPLDVQGRARTRPCRALAVDRV